MSLKNVDSENLLERWDELIDGYLAKISDLESLTLEIEKLRKELLLIREELLSRKIDPDKDDNVVGTQK